jgi:DNA-binding CsgD family transcriptional regulator
VDLDATRRRVAELRDRGAVAEALATLEAAAASAPEPAAAIRLLVDAVPLALGVAGPDRAVETAMRAVDLAESATDATDHDPDAIDVEREAARVRLGDALCWAGQYDQARAAWERAAASSGTTNPRLLAERANALLRLGDTAAHAAAFAALVAARAADELELVLDALNLVTNAEVRAGRLMEARATAEQVVVLVEGTGGLDEAEAHGLLAWPLALLGDEPACRAAIERAEHALERRRITGTGGLARGLLALSMGAAEEAMVAFEARLSGLRFGSVAVLTSLRPFGSELVESYARAGRIEQGRRVLAATLPVALGTGQPRLVAPMRRAQGILEGDEDAFQHALDAHAGWDNPFEKARTLLALGELLRRDRRRAEAREHLAQAVAAFDRVGARLWCDRAAAELRLAGERSPARSSIANGSVEPLTRQEGEIVELLRYGLSNREIAERLVLSVKTVEGHLTTIYGKLGVASRTKALAALAGVARASERGDEPPWTRRRP